MPRLRRPQASTAMKRALTYSEWRAAAEEADKANGGEQWRREDQSPHLAGDLMREDMVRMRELRLKRDQEHIQDLLQESLYRHQGDISNPANYLYALAGPKFLIEDYLDEVEASIHYLTDQEFPGFDTASKLEALRNAARNLGEPALLLSGGAAMGFFHLGVSKSLLEQQLLPSVISGASMGSLVGGGICSRTDDELHELLASPESIYRFGIRFHQPREIWQHRSLLDGQQLLRCAEENMGQESFAEMHARTGRQFSISVSPSRARQKPRVLSHQTSPQVVVARAVQASCAIPGIFAPVMLTRKDRKGETRPYLPHELWVDGSFQGDLPMKRLGRLFNVNHFIVSQTNPHAVPFLASRHGRGPLALVADLGLSSARAQAAQVMKVLQARIVSPPLHNTLEHARLLAEQEYKGDINIHPPVSGWMYRRLLSNPSVEDLHRYIELGERATWPKLAMIRNQTRVVRTLKQCIERLQK